MRTSNIQKLKRNYLPPSFKITTWKVLQPFLEMLAKKKCTSLRQLKAFLHHYSELQSVLGEHACWLQIKMTQHTDRADYQKKFNYFCTQIEPQVKPFYHRYHLSILQSPALPRLLASQPSYTTYIKSLQVQVELFKPINIPIQATLNLLEQKYAAIAGKMTFVEQGKEYTMPQAKVFLSQHNQRVRKRVYISVQKRRMQDTKTLNDLFTELIQHRHQIAINAGFKNYRDYKFAALNRTDYTPKDCSQFHNAIKKYILPLTAKLYEIKKNQLKLSKLKPWDVEAEPKSNTPLKPFTHGADLYKKTVAAAQNIHPFISQCLQRMKELKHLDLDSRKAKALGGYNCPLPETGVPFIFMNAASTPDDVVTLFHETGHAVHSFLCHTLPIEGFKEYPMEMAELASMSMELFSMDEWELFYKNKNELQRAKAQHLERILTIFPWIAIIDKFQHWLYTHPQHTVQERTNKWLEIHTEFTPDCIDWTGLEKYRAHLWQKQLHLFEVPFYYIEYGIAQLGAIALWKNYKKQPSQTLEQYFTALEKGNTMGLKQLYKTAGISFDFSNNTVKETSKFLTREIETHFAAL